MYGKRQKTVCHRMWYALPYCMNHMLSITVYTPGPLKKKTVYTPCSLARLTHSKRVHEAELSVPKFRLS